MLGLRSFEVLTFDCYGTIVDWENGIVAALRPIFAAYAARFEPEPVLEAYAVEEAALEAGPYLRYRDVLARVLDRLGERFGFTPSDEERERFAGSVVEWPPFADSVAALRELKRQFKLAIVTNCDDDLIAGTIAKLGVGFDWVVTAQQVGSYKPSPRNFLAAFERIGVPRERILHVAQSLFHDHVPAKRLGLTTVWVNRRHGKPGSGATPPADAKPDLEVPDLATLAAHA